MATNFPHFTANISRSAIETMKIKKLKDRLIMAGCAVVIILAIVLYTLFTTSQIFNESASHLAEIYDQVNATFQNMVTDNRKLMRSWEQYIINTTKEEGRWTEFKEFIDGQRRQVDEQGNVVKENSGFTDFYLIDLKNADRENNTAWGKKSDGTKEELEFRRDMNLLIGGNDVGVMVRRGNDRFMMFAVGLDDEHSFNKDGAFDYNAFAIVLDADALQKSLSVNAFKNEGLCCIMLSDGQIILQSSEVEQLGDNFIDFLGDKCTVTKSSLGELEHDWKSENEGDKKGTALFKSKADGKEYYLTYMPVNFSDWILLGIVPSEVVNSNMSHFRIITIIVMAAIFACLMGAVAWVMYLSNKRRISEKENDIKARENLLDLLTQNTNDMFVLFSSTDFSAEYVSSNISSVLGLDIEEVKTDIRKMLDASVEQHARFTAEGLKKLDDGDIWETDIQMRNVKTSEVYWYHLGLKHAVYNGKNEYVFMFSDRTKERKMSDDLASALALAKSANESKSNFLSNMSHDIRTPMNAIIGFATLLAKDADNPDKVREYIKKIMFSGHHLLSLINDILDMSKIESGKTSLNIEEFDISEFVDAISAIMTPQARAKKQEFEVHAKGVLPESVMGDKLRINQILLNLLSNAVKYTPEKGKIDLTVEALDKKVHKHAHLRFTVSDNGYGMSEEFCKIIFEPFARETTSATKEIQGTGLGMTITKNIVDLMGGTISVKSELGKGSTFVVELELAVADHHITDDEHFWEKHNIMKILVVDDEESICLDVQELMRETGVKVDYALSGKQAVKMVSDCFDAYEAYNLVLLDWKMPEMDGVETAKRIRAKVGKQVPIMVLTSYSFDEIEEEAKAAGIDLFLSKPFFVSNFRNAVIKLNKDEEDNTVKAANNEISIEGMNILAAEDNEINAEILEELLDIEGVTCKIAHDGREAVEMFEASAPGTYDMIFMDVQMPILNGYGATREIRASSHPDAKTIPIIAMTANAFDDDVKAALDSGMNAHLAKPIDMGKLKEIIAQLRGDRNE